MAIKYGRRQMQERTSQETKLANRDIYESSARHFSRQFHQEIEWRFTIQLLSATIHISIVRLICVLFPLITSLDNRRWQHVDNCITLAVTFSTRVFMYGCCSNLKMLRHSKNDFFLIICFSFYRASAERFGYNLPAASENGRRCL